MSPVKEETAMAVVRWNPMMPWSPTHEPWSPATGIESLRAGIDQLFNSFFGSMQPSGTTESRWYPRVDLREHDQEFVGVAHYRERAYGSFTRRFLLGAAVDADKISATYKAGVLEVHIPKTAAAQPKRIAVQSAA